MLDDEDLDAAVEAGLLDHELRARLEAFALERRRANFSRIERAFMSARFDAVHGLYYAGALLVIGALGLFANTAFLMLGGWALTATAMVYAAVFLWLGRELWAKADARLPGGLCVAVAVSMAPLAIYGASEAISPRAWGEPGLFPVSYPTRVLMEIGAIAAAALAIRYFPFPFILMIAAVAVWLLSMDFLAMIVHGRWPDWSGDFELRRSVSALTGLGMIGAAWAVDLRWAEDGDFGFWPHLIGAIILWASVTFGAWGMADAPYLIFNIVFTAFGVFVGRRIYAALGALGVTLALGRLAFDVLRNNTAAFSFALPVIALSVLLLGLVLERRRTALSALIDARLPQVLRSLRPPQARRA